MALVSLALLLAAGLEAGARFIVPQRSSEERRVTHEWQEAMTRRTAGPAQVLLVGNSLLGAGVDLDLLHHLLGHDLRVKRLLIENTAFYDWYYGGRRLFAEGAECDYFAVVLSPRQLISNGIDGDYFAHHLMRLSDLWGVARSTRAGGDTWASMALARISAFWGLRRGIRNWVLETLIPHMKVLAQALAPRDSRRPSPQEVRALAADRLHRLAQVATVGGARLVLIIPPLLADEGLVQAVEDAGRRVGVSVVVPIRPGELPNNCFSDAFHLNPTGAGRFTARLATSLRALVPPGSSRPSPDPSLHPPPD